MKKRFQPFLMFKYVFPLLPAMATFLCILSISFSASFAANSVSFDTEVSNILKILAKAEQDIARVTVENSIVTEKPIPGHSSSIDPTTAMREKDVYDILKRIEDAKAELYAEEDGSYSQIEIPQPALPALSIPPDPRRKNDISGILKILAKAKLDVSEVNIDLPPPSAMKTKADQNKRSKRKPRKIRTSKDVRGTNDMRKLRRSPTEANNILFSYLDDNSDIRKRLSLELDVRETYYSNIYYRKDNPAHDFITNIIPKISGKLENTNHLLEAKYRALVFISLRHPLDDRINHEVIVNTELFRMGKIKLSFKNITEPKSSPPSSENTKSVKMLHNYFIGDISYSMSPKTSISMAYSNTLQNYSSGNYEDFSHMQHTLSPAFHYHLSPKTSVFLDYVIGVTRYDGGKNYDSIYNEIGTGIDGKLSAKSLIKLRAGFQYRTYDDQDIENAPSIVLSSEYLHKFSPKTSISLRATSAVNESTYENYGWSRNISLSSTIDHKVFTNLEYSAGLSYSHGGYPGEDETKPRTDNSYRFHTEIRYQFYKWLESYLGYDFSTRHSNIRSLEYKNHRMEGGIKFRY
jgi:putative beta-barrel porin BBP2